MGFERPSNIGEFDGFFLQTFLGAFGALFVRSSGHHPKKFHPKNSHWSSLAYCGGESSRLFALLKYGLTAEGFIESRVVRVLILKRTCSPVYYMFYNFDYPFWMRLSSIQRIFAFDSFKKYFKTFGYSSIHFSYHIVVIEYRV
jgi:hypothetical protein